MAVREWFTIRLESLWMFFVVCHQLGWPTVLLIMEMSTFQVLPEASGGPVRILKLTGIIHGIRLAFSHLTPPLSCCLGDCSDSFHRLKIQRDMLCCTAMPCATLWLCTRYQSPSVALQTNRAGIVGLFFLFCSFVCLWQKCKRPHEHMNYIYVMWRAVYLYIDWGERRWKILNRVSPFICLFEKAAFYFFITLKIKYNTCFLRITDFALILVQYDLKCELLVLLVNCLILKGNISINNWFPDSLKTFLYLWEPEVCHLIIHSNYMENADFKYCMLK